MTWKYIIEWHNLPSNQVSHHSIVMVTSKSRSQAESHLIKIKAWLDDTSLYTQVLKGDNPIINAKVQASVSLELSSNGTKLNLGHWPLYDNGFGDPDIMQGDGIYTRYLTFQHRGRYTFNIEVTDNNNKAFYATQFASKPGTVCCGSSVLSHIKSMKRVGTFTRHQSGPVLFIHHLNTNNGEDEIPPAKIGDLRIKPLLGAMTPDRLLASWTAPGDNYDQGSVSSYRFVFSPNLQDLLDPSQGQPEVLLGFDRQEKSGTEAQFDFNFPHENGKDYYVGAYAFDLAGNRGKISNLVHVKLSQSLPKLRHIDTEEREENASIEDDWVIIGSICGIISVLFVMAISSVSYYVYMSR